MPITCILETLIRRLTRARLCWLILSYCITVNGLLIPISPSNIGWNEKVECIDSKYLQDNMLETINLENNKNVETAPKFSLDEKKDPFDIFPFVAELALEGVASIVPGGGLVLTVGKTTVFKIFGFLITNLDKTMQDDSLEGKINDYVSELTSTKIQENNVKIIKSVTNGVSDVYQLFTSRLQNYFSLTTGNQTDLRSQVFNSFDDVVSHIIKEQRLLLDVEKSAGLPFYLHTCSLFVSAHVAVLGNAASLNLTKEYFIHNYKTLRESIDQFNDKIYTAIQTQMDIFKGNYEKCNQYLRGIYVSGFSLYQAIVKKSYELEYEVPFKRWNSLELYHNIAKDNDVGKPPAYTYNQFLLETGKDMVKRTLMLQRMETRHSRDNIFRFKQIYYNVLKEPDMFESESCLGMVDEYDALNNYTIYSLNDKKDYLVPEDIHPAVKYKVYGDYHWHKSFFGFALDNSQGQSFMIGISYYNTRNYYFNIPGYFFNGIHLRDYPYIEGRSCKFDYDRRMEMFYAIFRHYDSFEVQTVLLTGDLRMQKNVSYELDFNHGFLTRFSDSKQVYADTIVGKNCAVLVRDAVFIIPSAQSFSVNVSDPIKFTVLVQCASTVNDQVIDIVLRLGDVYRRANATVANGIEGSVIATGSSRITNSELAFDKKIQKVTPLLEHPIEKKKVTFFTHAIDLDYRPIKNIVGRNIFVFIYFEQTHTILSEVTLIVTPGLHAKGQVPVKLSERVEAHLFSQKSGIKE